MLACNIIMSTCQKFMQCRGSRLDFESSYIFSMCISLCLCVFHCVYVATPPPPPPPAVFNTHLRAHFTIYYLLFPLQQKKKKNIFIFSIVFFFYFFFPPPPPMALSAYQRYILRYIPNIQNKKNYLIFKRNASNDEVSDSSL